MSLESEVNAAETASASGSDFSSSLVYDDNAGFDDEGVNSIVGDWMGSVKTDVVELVVSFSYYSTAEVVRAEGCE